MVLEQRFILREKLILLTGNHLSFFYNLHRRAFDTLTVGDAPAETLPVQSSMLTQTHKLGVLVTLQQSFQRVQFLQLYFEGEIDTIDRKSSFLFL